MKIEISKVVDLVPYQQKFNISRTASLSIWVVEILRSLADEGIEEVEFNFNPELLCSTYSTSPHAWAKFLGEKVVGMFPHLQGRREQGRIILRASQTHRTSTFLARVVEHLKEYKTFTVNKEEIPPAHVRQPYPILARLRLAGIEHPKLTINEDSITYYV